jgi:hypothetical protein
VAGKPVAAQAVARILSRMSNGRIWVRWFLVPVVLAASTVAAWLALWLIALDQAILSLVASAHLNFPPSDLLHIADLVSVFLILAIWVVPVAWAVGFAMRARAALALLWGFAISLLLTATFVWSRAHPYSRTFAIAAGMGAICGIVFLVVRKVPVRPVLAVEVASFLLLFVPSLLVVVLEQKQPPPAHKIWSVVLQKESWQGMNTGSEYGATRQLTFAGDRIIAVFDAGSAGYDGKWPQSKYRVLSLDRDTGAVRNQMEFTGRWGSMPYVYGTRNGKVDLVNAGRTSLLNPDLSQAEATANAKGSVVTASPEKASVGKGNFAGVSQNGKRFALQFSDQRGDPSVLLYERFVIYDSTTAKPVASILIDSLPERQSWSAFSPDGRYFAVGNPNKLSLYAVP